MPPKLSTFTDPGEALASFCEPFVPRGQDLGHVAPVAADDLPDAYRRLLAHHEHMTATLRAFHGGDVRLSVIEAARDGEMYRRHIHLLDDRGRAIEVGYVRIDLRFTAPAVRAAILAGQEPLGDILIRANVLRRIEPRWYYRFGAGCGMLEELQSAAAKAFGRLGTIYCDGAPAIELLEIVTEAALEPLRGPGDAAKP